MDFPGFGDVQTWGAAVNAPGSPYYNGDHPHEAEARDHLLACPADWQLWFSIVSTAREGAAFDVVNVREEDMASAHADVLLACLFAGTRAQADAARFELQSRFLAHNERRVQQIADSMFASSEPDSDPYDWEI
jgi:hypothetical protein